MPSLAVLILTRNEEAHIEACIKSASFADEIVIIDSGSTDRTQEKATAMGAKFITHPMGEDGFAGQRNFALTQTDADWVFYLDADERITKEAVPAVQKIVEANVPAAYQVERKNVVFGKMMHYGGHRPDFVCRLYPRAEIHWQGKVHEGVETNLPKKTLKNVLLHYTYTTWKQYFTKFNQYTTLAAQAMFERGKRVGKGGVLGHTAFTFIRDYFLRKGFLDGFMGLTMSVMATGYTFTKYLKLMNLYRLQEQDRSNK
ncbi:glycosyltransferase family 2 protein [uncultured Mitsuokella sp.]|uniref:glycosyltransferase family 2 protein n=1 Tax=uncultured Mitsuokella sp. TaxID=453120 RepID=UPI0025CD3477|nr:glycosyltransferase family 2 protein [uncultured Mitsuokella sp.]